MISVEWLIELACKSLILAAATLGLLALARKRSAAERSQIGDAGLLSLVLLPALLAFLPRTRIAPPQPVASAFETFVQQPVAASAVSRDPATVAAPVQAASTFDWNSIALFGYLVPAIGLAAALVYAIVRLRRLYRRARVLQDARWLTALAAAQNRMGVKHGTALLISDEINSPISWGVVRPVIMIDAVALAAADHAEPVIAHELAHVDRLDWVKLIIARLAIAMFWFNPLVWALARLCHELREESADDAVLRSSVEKSQYADVLLTAVRHANAQPLLAANGVAPSLSSLSRRIMRVLDGSNNRLPAPTTWKLACFGGAMLISAPLAAVTLSALPIVEIATATAVSPSSRSASLPGVAPKVQLPNAEIRSVKQSSGLLAAAPAAAGGAILSPVFAEAMITAARSGDTATLRQLMASGASVNAMLRGDGTPLIAAVRAGRIDVAAFLLASGANPSLGVPGDGSPLIVAARGGRRDLIELLLSRGAAINGAVPGDGTPLIAAAAAGHEDIVRLLLDRGASLEQVVPEDENALITASRSGQANVVRLLIGRGANVNSQAFGRTPLAMAQLRNRNDIVDMLRKAGAVR